MACGLPILVSDKVGCAVDLVKDGRNGYVFRTWDAADLSQKMQLLSSNSMIMREMGAASRELIRSWSIERAAAAVEDLTSVLQIF